MFPLRRAARHLAYLLPAALLALQPLAGSALAAQGTAAPAPRYLLTAGETPWIYEGSDLPRDDEWRFGKMPNGLRYAVRRNGVPPGQVSIRVRIDAGSLHERDAERGYAHLLEHLAFRESRYLGVAQAIPTWQRLGATFGSDTNAETSPTHTVFKLDLPGGADPAKLSESLKLLSGMVREPRLTTANVRAEVPIVLAEKRDNSGPAERTGEQARQTIFAGQLLSRRAPIGTEATLAAATGRSVEAFHRRWYRPENAVVVVVGDVDPLLLAATVERWFGDWRVRGRVEPAPSFGDPQAPASADPANPVGETAVMVEPDLPRAFSYAILRPWRRVADTVAYNQGLLRGRLAEAIVNRRLERRARAGGSYLYAEVEQDKISRSADTTIVSFAPLTADWRAALSDVRGVIADALEAPPSAEELAREIAGQQQQFESAVAERSVMAGGRLADDMVTAVDIGEAVASPETALAVFTGMKDTITPEQILEAARRMFAGTVIRATYVTPAVGEAEAGDLATALRAPSKPDPSARAASAPISFASLPAIGKPGTILREAPIGVHDISQVDFANGVKAVVWAAAGEPGRVTVKVRFGGGYRAFGDNDAAYIALGKGALVGSGLGPLGQEELDRIAAGRKMGFDFAIEDGTFTFFAQTRREDVADQLYLFAAKLGMPRWDTNPVVRARAAALLAFESYATSPAGVLERDFEGLSRGGDPRYASPTRAALEAATPEGFRQMWEPILRQGPVEVLVFGDIDRTATVQALARTFGALGPRAPLAPASAARLPGYGPAGATEVRYHRGEASQAAAVVQWRSGGGVAALRESRQLQILVQLFNNRLLDAMRERAGASYSPTIRSDWPTDIAGGGRIAAIGQLRPEDVPVFFAEARRIAADLAATPPTADELARVTEPLRQTITRVSTGSLFWLLQLEGVTADPRVATLLGSLMPDYTRTTPEVMQALARKYFGSEEPWQLAVLPEGQRLAKAPAPLPPAPSSSAPMRPGR
ncbi:M16 family metallopeptidase [Qipengyuania sediminis]|uniref:M16 family metallopeptidase n=1 Tax=Qipengyuania sediminis TaxID=1532023 RepID=UPI0010593E10|nr:M16 family metallopeptidase [Qipengyuania sediminis]